MPKVKKNEEKTPLTAQFDNTVNINSYVQAAFVEAADDSDTTITTNSRGRARVSSSNSLKNRFPFVDALPDPFHCTKDGYGVGGSYVDIRDVILLVEKAAFSFAPLRNTIETQVELANDEMFLKGANKKARTFVKKWLERIGIWHLGDNYYRDYFQSANVYIYRFDATMSEKSLQQLQTVYGKEFNAEAAVKLPIKYVLLDPASMARPNGMTYDNQFVKVLSQSEVAMVKNPKTDEEKEFAKQFSPEELKKIKETGRGAVLKLDPLRLYYSAYKRQPYHGFGIPFAFSVLQDIDYKLLLKQLDREIAKNLDFSVLHWKVGMESNGQLLINKDTIANIQTLYQNPKLQRVLVTGFDVDGKWIVPPVEVLLGKGKYEQVNSDIEAGLLSSIFNENTKFASLSIKVQVMIQRLQEARKAFLEDFLIPEIKRVCQLMGFKTFPVPYFTDINLEDPNSFRKIVLRLLELGFLTPENMEEAIVKGIFPNIDEMEEYQKTFKSQKDAGLWLPQLNRVDPATLKPVGGVGGQTGRPGGSSGTPQGSKKPGKIGAKGSFSLKQIAETFVSFDKLDEEVKKELSKTVDKKDKENFERMSFNLSQAISLTRDKKDWYTGIAEFIKNPQKPQDEEIKSIREIEENFEIENERQATILYLSNKE